jgi:hypothetical protein
MKGLESLLKMFGLSREDMQNHVTHAKAHYEVERKALHDKLDIIIAQNEKQLAFMLTDDIPELPSATQGMPTDCNPTAGELQSRIEMMELTQTRLLNVLYAYFMRNENCKWERYDIKEIIDGQGRY